MQEHRPSPPTSAAPSRARTSVAGALIAVCLGLAVGGCKHTGASTADDNAASVALRKRLSADAALTSEQIQTSVQNGVATLDGGVSSEAARALAASDASQVPGIRTVVNNLTVQSANLTIPPPQNPVQTPAETPSTSVTAPPPSPLPTLSRKPSGRIEPHAAAPAQPDRPQDRNRASTQNPQNPQNAQNTQNTQNAPIERISPANTPPPQIVQAPPRPVAREVTIPSGTSLPVHITQTLDSASTPEGSTFSGTLATDVLVDGLVALSQGSNVTGRVDTVQDAGHFKGNSLLVVELTGVSAHGNRLPISTDTFRKEGTGRGKNTAEKAGGGAAVGAILGGIFGGGKGAAIGAAAGGGAGAGVNAVTRGQQVQILPETLVRFRLQSPITVRVTPGATQSNPDANHRRPLEPTVGPQNP